MDLLAKKFFINKIFLTFSFFTCCAFLIRYLLALQDLPYLDRLFLPDDTYYILTISRSIAAGLGPSVDGIHLTNGFQPLIVLLQIPIFLFKPTADQAVVVAVYLSAFWGGLSTLVLGYLLLNLGGMRAAIIGCLFWALCPTIIKNDLNGMETSLTGFLSLLVLLCTVLTDQKKSFFRLFCLGLVCGLALLARVDTCFLLIPIGIFACLSWGWRAAAYVAVVALLVVTPWWYYVLNTFGTVVPESGAALRTFLVEGYQGMTPAYFVRNSLGALISWFPFFLFSKTTVCVGILITFYLILKKSSLAKDYAPILIIPVILYLFFYTGYLPAYWFFTRYYYSIYLVIIIILSLFLGAARGRGLEQFSSFVVAVILISFAINLIPWFEKPTKAISDIKGYREVALSIEKRLPPESIVGSFQSGALGYYAPKSVRIINLDGVVNREATDALKQRRMKAYIDAQHLTHFADWKMNVILFKKMYGRSFSEACFLPIYRAKKQVLQQFTLYTFQADCSKKIYEPILLDDSLKRAFKNKNSQSTHIF